eukprot:3434296-Prymnesium_polylepis.1
MLIFERVLHHYLFEAVEKTMWPCGQLGSCNERPASGDMSAAFAAYVGMRLCLILLASLLTLWQPWAEGSGMPQVKANMNGTHIPGYLSLRTLVAKYIGITLVVSTGLPLDKEGPMIHMAAAVAVLVGSLKLSSHFPNLCSALPEISDSTGARQLVSMGAAAGMAAAFEAPLGGILYSFEEHACCRVRISRVPARPDMGECRGQWRR